jgi:hypothetical protein
MTEQNNRNLPIILPLPNYWIKLNINNIHTEELLSFLDLGVNLLKNRACHNIIEWIEGLMRLVGRVVP